MYMIDGVLFNQKCHSNPLTSSKGIYFFLADIILKNYNLKAILFWALEGSLAKPTKQQNGESLISLSLSSFTYTIVYLLKIHQRSDSQSSYFIKKKEIGL